MAKIKRFFVAQDNCQCTAVCVPLGARLLVHDIHPRLQREVGLDGNVEEVVFTQIGISGFRDAIRFANGAEVLLQRLKEGQRVRVLSLACAEPREVVPNYGHVGQS